MQNTMGLNFRRRVIYQALRETFSNLSGRWNRGIRRGFV